MDQIADWYWASNARRIELIEFGEEMTENEKAEFDELTLECFAELRRAFGGSGMIGDRFEVVEQRLREEGKMEVIHACD